MKKILLILFLLIPFIVRAENCTIVSGNGTTIGDEIACGTEHFYVIDSNETDVQVLAKYNINVGDKIDYFDVNEETTYYFLDDYSTMMKERCNALAVEKGYNPYYVYVLNEFDSVNQSYTITGCRVYERMNGEHIRQDERAIGTKLDGNGKSILPIYGITYMVPSWGYDAIINNSSYINDYDEMGNLRIEGSSFEKYLNDYKSELTSQNIATSKVSFPTLDIMKNLLTKIGGRDFEVALEYNSATNMYNVTYENYIGKMDIKDYIPSKYNWIYSVTYWLGSGYKNEEEGKNIFDYHGSEFNDYYITNEGVLCSLGRGECGYFGYPIGNGLRPLVTLPKSSITIPVSEPETGNATIVDNMYNIISETDGKGSVEVVKTAHSGDKISFRVAPQANYKISSLTIFDKAGNSITFSEDQIINNNDGTISINSFTMPSDDVRIIAKFESIIAGAIEEVLINPKTGVFSPIFIFVGTLIASGIAYVILLRKKLVDIQM